MVDLPGGSFGDDRLDGAGWDARSAIEAMLFVDHVVQAGGSSRDRPSGALRPAGVTGDAIAGDVMEDKASRLSETPPRATAR